MNDKILTDSEKNALVQGVESGEVEVQSSKGPAYAAVTPFRIPRRAHIVKDSYPRMNILNQQIAERFRRDLEQLLQSDVDVSAGELKVRTFGQVCEQLHGLSASIVFEAQPLSGRALVVAEPPLVRALVNTFFGGTGNGGEPEQKNTLTRGEISISNLFATVLMSAIRETWAPLQEIAADRLSTEVSIDLVDIGTESDPVISNEFEVSISDQRCLFHLVWPVEMIKPMLPVFDGQKRERDPVEDARWERVLRRRLADSAINLTSNVGYTQITLGQLIDLSPGDVIDIQPPQDATILAKNVRLIRGRLGVHHGRNAVEALGWIENETPSSQATGN